MNPSLDDLPDDPAALKAIIAAERAEVLRMAASVRAYEILVQSLRLRVARLQRQRFGPSSERIGREVEQLRLALETSRSRPRRRTRPPSPSRPRR
jgi:transposase